MSIYSISVVRGARPSKFLPRPSPNSTENNPNTTSNFCPVQNSSTTDCQYLCKSSLYLSSNHSTSFHIVGPQQNFSTPCPAILCINCQSFPAENQELLIKLRSKPLPTADSEQHWYSVMPSHAFMSSPPLRRAAAMMTTSKSRPQQTSHFLSIPNRHPLISTGPSQPSS